MSQNRYAQFSGIPMSQDAIDRLLEQQGYGVLSLCDEATPYSIPISFGYSGEAIYIPFLIEGPQSTKAAITTEGTVARLLVTDIKSRFDWQSVSVTGAVSLVDPDEAEFEQFIRTLNDNGWFMSGFQQADSLDSFQGWRLHPEEIRGLERTEQPIE